MSGPWKTAWITGASHGIGRALAEQLADGGVTVAVSARGETVLQGLHEAQPGIVPFPLDVTDEAAVAATLEAIEHRNGLPDLAILNAGIYEPRDAGAVTAEDYRRHMEVNYLGVTNCLAVLLPRMLARGTGQIAIVGSVAGYRGLPQAAAYGPTKAALNNLAETLRLELQDSGVDIRLVSPGFVATRLTDKNSFAMPAIMTPAAASAAIIKGLQAKRFEIAFPRRFVAWLKFARILPWGLYGSLVRRITKQ